MFGGLDFGEVSEEELVEILLEHGIVAAMFVVLVERDVDHLDHSVLLLLLDVTDSRVRREMLIESNQVVDEGKDIEGRFGFGIVCIIEITETFCIENGRDVLGRAEEIDWNRVSEIVDEFIREIV